MFKLVVFCALATLTVAQYQKNSREAAIITDARYLNGNGQFGSSYTQEDGVEFKEETDANGNRVGSYSYVDPSGQKRTISYTAGKNGFIASGDGVPVTPAPVAPQPQYNPAPQQWNQPQQQQQQWNAPAQQNWDDSANQKWDQWDDQSQWDQPSTPAPAPVQNWNQPQMQVQWTAPAQQPQWAQVQAQPQAPAQPQAQWTQPAANQYSLNSITTTPPPHRFYPPGKLSLNRSPDGFSYTFNKA